MFYGKDKFGAFGCNHCQNLLFIVLDFVNWVPIQSTICGGKTITSAMAAKHRHWRKKFRTLAL
jgi:hypothetical protein